LASQDLFLEKFQEEVLSLRSGDSDNNYTLFQILSSRSGERTLWTYEFSVDAENAYTYTNFIGINDPDTLVVSVPDESSLESLQSWSNSKSFELIVFDSKILRFIPSLKLPEFDLATINEVINELNSLPFVTSVEMEFIGVFTNPLVLRPISPFWEHPLSVETQKRTTWLGEINDLHYPWIFHYPTNAWIWCNQEEVLNGNILGRISPHQRLSAYSTRLGWIYLNEEIYPWTYSWENSSYVYVTEVGWAYIISRQEWVSLF
jgi:hypothetical protein